ncbi:hypothetical protein SIID45300_02451 [Candidatus Magnetaquicoccaceae bacterium FCR-1]|uniref:NACHT domain-containing protein n=1 Tax=Candidatus Magnetaquiglobus chichijimensis TaxID=3141448 RepID=A0ABQ0CB35_9PROT
MTFAPESPKGLMDTLSPDFCTSGSKEPDVERATYERLFLIDIVQGYILKFLRLVFLVSRLDDRVRKWHAVPEMGILSPDFNVLWKENGATGLVSGCCDQETRGWERDVLSPDLHGARVMSVIFDRDTLPKAVASLLRLNNYDVRGPEEIHGAEIDIIAEHLSDPFSPPLYIEVTIEYVDNDKYGKDLTKIILLREKRQDAQFLIVSGKGFTAPVRERAREARINTLTYDELFSKFERFDPYIQYILNSGKYSDELAHLDAVYEEPHFDDVHGTHPATEFLTNWLSRESRQNRWIVVVGEYGTGKTALTRVLQRRWVNAYRANPASPIPFRVELRNFNRQFDANSLLHYFLDSNKLGHIPIDFVNSLIRSGRVVLLLDGYDEMAQYMHIRERRVCLEALSRLSAEGACGVLTSRPNYFTETEELHVYEALYATVDRSSLGVDRSDAETIKREREIDATIEAHILERYERTLQDLSRPQTEALVGRILNKDADGKKVVFDLLDRIYRTEHVSGSKNLSGKPVIISYLLDILDTVKTEQQGVMDAIRSEWAIFDMIVTNLMRRDFKRSPVLQMQHRRKFLQKLAIWLSKKGHQFIEEFDFVRLIEKEFKNELARHASEDRKSEIERLFADLRSSGTLTRSGAPGTNGWQFSHNSLREYLVAELLLNELQSGRFFGDGVYVSDAMRLFVASQQDANIEQYLTKLTNLWPDRTDNQAAGEILSLLWDAGLRVLGDSDGQSDPVNLLLRKIGSGALDLSRTILRRVILSREIKPSALEGANFSSAHLIDIDLSSAKLERASFNNTLLDNVCFVNAGLCGSSFTGAILTDVDLSGADLEQADFLTVDEDDISIKVDGRTFNGRLALGYLKSRKATTNDVPEYFVIYHHPSFDIAEKICRLLTMQAKRQRRGLEQRGVANRNPEVARRFVRHLISQNLVEVDTHELISPTEIGRNIFRRFCDEQIIENELASFFQVINAS